MAIDNYSKRAYLLVYDKRSERNDKGKYHSPTLWGRKKLGVYSLSKQECDRYVFLSARSFKEIFDKPQTGNGKYHRVPPMIKISANGKSIYREYIHVSEIHGMEDFAGLTYTSMSKLSSSIEDMNSINRLKLEKASIFKCVCYHKDFKWWVGIILALVSIFLTVICSIYI